MKYLAVILMIGLSLPALAATYRWVDANGVVHYSDRPQEGAQQIEVSAAQGYTPSSPARATAPANNRARQDAAAAPAYQSLRVVRPAPQETYRNIGGQLTVSLSLSPALIPGHRIQVLYDGQPVKDWPERLLSFTLTGIYRGEHNLKAQVLDGSGKPVAASDSVTFFVHQTNLINRVRN